MKYNSGKKEFRGWYLLDNGGGLEKYKDQKHIFAIEPCSNEEKADKEAACIVAACGKTQFGHFISAGIIKRDKAGKRVLTLVRRYIDTEDIRHSYQKPILVMEKILQQMDTDKRKLPWQCEIIDYC